MAKRKKTAKQYFRYQCTLTGEKFTVSQKAPSPEELLSVRAYYEIHPEMDDRPEIIKLKAGQMTEDEYVQEAEETEE